MKSPLVSIVITNFNRDSSIGNAIESALAQDYPNLEIVISDNCSTDNSHTIISKYTHDSRIKYYRNENNIGMFDNFKESFLHRAKGDFISIVNSDDQYINSKFISQSIQLVNDFPNVVLVKSAVEISKKHYKQYQLYNNKLNFYSNIDFLNQHKFDIDLGWAGILIDRKVFQKINLENYRKIVGFDFLSNLELLTYGNLAINNNISYKFNVHNSNLSLNQFSKIQVELHLERIRNILNLYDNRVDRIKLLQQYTFYLIKNAIEETYIYKRESLNLVKEEMKKLDLALYVKYINSYRWFKIRLLYKIVPVGYWITFLKFKLKK